MAHTALRASGDLRQRRHGPRQRSPVGTAPSHTFKDAIEAGKGVEARRDRAREVHIIEARRDRAVLTGSSDACFRTSKPGRFGLGRGMAPANIAGFRAQG
mmetsp:Transcript_117674/g.332933  ORF Transcript_117674/g.332933 Transcript_117674/m.332933 type:complete len:100 (+) Transcript_117674:1098-1397(+)